MTAPALPAADEAAIASWQLYMQARGFAPRTVRDRARILRLAGRRAGETPLTMTTDGCAGFLASVESQNTRRIYYVTIKGWQSWLTETGRREDDPMKHLPAPKAHRGEPRPITVPQLQTLLGTRMHRRGRAMILLAAYQGLRVHEVAKIRGEDVDLEAGTLRVTGKGGTAATLPIHPLIAALAVDYPRRGYWFTAYTGARPHVRGQSVSATIGKAMRRAGVPGTPHALRHWYGTELVRGGADLRTVQSLMRHADLNTTAIYTQVADTSRFAAVLRLPAGGQ